MTDLTPEQLAAIERIDAKLDKVPKDEQLKRMMGALSVSRQQVDASLEEKKKAKQKQPPNQ